MGKIEPEINNTGEQKYIFEMVRGILQPIMKHSVMLISKKLIECLD